MSEDGEKDQDKGTERPSRPVTASARRERRASSRPGGEQGDKGRTKRPVAKGESVGRKDTPTAKRDRAEDKQPLFKRLMRFIREVWAELRKVIWPTRKQMITYTIVVLVFVTFMITLVALLDLVFAKAVFALFG